MTKQPLVKRRLPTGATPPEHESLRSAWTLVARREVMVKVTDRAFLIGTVVTLAIIALFMGGQAYMGSRTQDFTVAATPQAVQMVERLRAGAPEVDDDVEVSVHRVADDSAARAALMDESADAWLRQDGDTWVLTSKSETESSLEAVATDVVRNEVLRANAEAAGTSADALQRGTVLQTSLLEGNATRAELVGIVGFAFAFLFYLAALMFGITLANSVLEEKQSRIVEIIATSIPVRQLLAGKVIGNTLLAVAQLALFVAVGMIGLAFTEYSALVTAISGPVVWFVVFFLAGFTALACLWAVAGSLASRAEDLQSTTTPLTMLIMAVLFGGLFLEGVWQTIGSFVPPLSAVMMPMRLLEGGVAWWEPVLALLLLIATAALTVVVGERIYRRSLLQTQGIVSLRKAWRLEE